MTIEEIKNLFPEEWKPAKNSVGYCYVTYCSDTNEFYIGKRKAKNFSQTYYGSGTVVKRWKANNLNLEHWPISWSDNVQELLDQENDWVFKARMVEGCVNILPGGAPAMLGKHHTEETKQKMREAALKIEHKPLSQETKDRISASNIGKHNKTNEERKAISDFHKGRKRSAETCKNIGLSKSGKNNPNFGKPRSEETRKKISEAQKGRKFTPEHREKLRQAHLRRKEKLKEENSHGEK